MTLGEEGMRGDDERGTIKTLLTAGEIALCKKVVYITHTNDI